MTRSHGSGTPRPKLSNGLRRVSFAAVIAMLFALIGAVSATSASATPDGQFVAGVGPAVQVDTSASGIPADGATFRTKVSADGHLVAFTTSSTNLIPGDSNNADDVVQKNMLTGEVRLVSSASDGAQANGYSFTVDMTPDGRYVLFCSYATNLATVPNDGHFHLYLKDMQTGGVELADASSDGTAPVMGTQAGSLSANGRFIVFVGYDTGFPEVYRRDRASGATVLVTQRLDGRATYSAGIDQPRVTDDGRYVTFTATENWNGVNLGFFSPESPYYSAGDAVALDGFEAIYQRDMASLSYSVLNVDTSGAVVPFKGNWDLSRDARYVVYQLNSGFGSTIWRRDNLTSALVEVSVDSQGNTIPGAVYNSVMYMSGDGNRILFDDPSTTQRDLVRDVLGRTTYDVSIEQLNGHPYSGSVGVSGDGSHVVVTINSTGPRGPYTGDPQIFERYLPPSDTTAPIVNAVLSPQPNAARWNNTPVQVSWTASDEDSTATTPSPVTVSAEGKDQSVTSGQSCDPSNNCSVGTTKVSIDTTPPTVVATVSGSQNAQGSYIGTVMVHYACSDVLSGVASCPSDVTLTQPGANQSVSRTAIDVAGNVNIMTVSGISIATPAPSLVVTTPQNDKLHKGSPVAGTVQTQAVIASVTATYTPQGSSHAPETLTGTVTAGQTVNGVTTYTYTIPTPSDFNGRMQVAITVTDSYGQSVTSAPVSVVVN